MGNIVWVDFKENKVITQEEHRLMILYDKVSKGVESSRYGAYKKPNIDELYDAFYYLTPHYPKVPDEVWNGIDGGKDE